MPPSKSTSQAETIVALLDQKVDHLLALVNISNSKMDLYTSKTDICLQQLVTGAAVTETRFQELASTVKDFKDGLKDCDDKIDGVIQKTNWWSGLNTALGLFANAVAGYFAVKKF
jgi:hypothetical protein